MSAIHKSHDWEEDVTQFLNILNSHKKCWPTQAKIMFRKIVLTRRVLGQGGIQPSKKNGLHTPGGHT